MAANEANVNNAAGRLHKILSRAKSSGAPHVLNAFATAFDLPNTEVSQVLLNLGRLGLSVDEVSEELKRINATETLALYLDSVPHLKSALSLQNLGMTWETFKNHIRDEDLRALLYCSKDLAKFSHEEVLSDQQLKDLKTKVEELYENVFSSTDVEPELRRVILGHLESIKQAIHDYRIAGLRPLAEALSITALTLVEPRKKKRGKSKTDKQKPTLDKIRQFVKDTMLMINFWKLTHPMLVYAKDHLPQLVDKLEKAKDFLLPPP
jgi:hypothetical protein